MITKDYILNCYCSLYSWTWWALRIQEMEEKKEMKAADISCLYDSIKAILSNARQQAYRAVNFAMVKSYWLVGQRIVEHEHFFVNFTKKHPQRFDIFTKNVYLCNTRTRQASQ